METKLAEDGFSIDVNVEMVDVTTMWPNMEPDPHWRAFDGHGHEHRWVDKELPSLEYIITNRWYCCDCGDEHTEEVYVCLECGEEVEPGWRVVGREPGGREYKPGLTTIRGHVFAGHSQFETLKGQLFSDGAPIGSLRLGDYVLTGVRASSVDDEQADFIAEGIKRPTPSPGD